MACRFVYFVMVYNNNAIRNGTHMQPWRLSREYAADRNGWMTVRAPTKQRAKHDVAYDEAAEDIDIGPLSRMIGYALRRAQISVFEDFIATLSEVDLRPAQFSVLLVLDRAPGSTQSAVASALGIKRANFVALLDELAARGLAERKLSASDKRSNAIHLTDKGRRILARARALAQDHENRQIARLGKDGPETLLNDLARLAGK